MDGDYKQKGCIKGTGLIQAPGFPVTIFVSVTVIKLFFNNVSKQLQQLHSQNGCLPSLNEPHVITAPKTWGEARLIS